MPAMEQTSPLPVPDKPHRARGVELRGELEAPGFRDRQWLVERDGRFLQVTELVYRVLEHADGSQSLEEIAAAITAETEWLVSCDDIRSFLRSTLIPRGLVAGPRRPRLSGTTHSPDTSRRMPYSPLRLNMRARTIGPSTIDPIARLLQVLFTPPILILLVAAAVSIHWWLYAEHGLARPLVAALTTPGGLLAIMAALLSSSAFHEFGHAAALRYGGVRARSMGVGLYIVYPMFYTDTSEAYRLGRWARVRTDLAGMYFDLVFTILVVLLYFATGFELVLIVVPLVDYRIIRQCLPFVRMDGYWALADLTGMTDFFSHVKPFIASLRRSRAQLTGASPLKRWATVMFVLYLALTVPALVLFFLLLARGLPDVVATSWTALGNQIATFWMAQSTGDVLVMVTAIVQSILTVLPLVAVAYMLFSQTRQVGLLLWKWSGYWRLQCRLQFERLNNDHFLLSRQ
jgi:putative peptide zinc metalloprotease protein